MTDNLFYLKRAQRVPVQNKLPNFLRNEIKA
jgi:hypothetical protein